MISKDERDAIRAQLIGLAHDRQSFFCDDGDDEVVRADYDALIKAVRLLDALDELEAERDRWKARAEAIVTDQACFAEPERTCGDE